MYTGGSERLRIDTSGNVGIGTSSPVGQLTLNKSSDLNFLQGGYGISWGATSGSSPRIIGSASDAIRFFAGGGSEAMRIDSSGNVLVGITSARANAGDVQVSKGISFPATQSAQSDANTLDDYEEGTFTPTVQGVTSAGTASYSVQLGSYTKIGNLVYVNIYLSYSSGTGTGQLRIAGLPFTSAGSLLPIASVYLDNIAVTAAHYPMNLMNASSTTIDFYQSAGGGAGALTYDAAGTILLSLTYRV
jgi:hypothetical protein